MNKLTSLEHHGDAWSGYSIDDVRYQRALMLARIELAKERLLNQTQNMRNGIPRFGGGIVGKVLGSLNYIDYAVIAYKIGSRIYKLVNGVRRRK